MRDNTWLKSELELLLKKYFSDVELTNPIEIKFGREAKYRFGSIRLLKSNKGYKRAKGDKGRGLISNFKFKISNSKQPAKSIITITSMFVGENIPVAVVRHTIAHELCHYAHGFSSTNKRLFRHPHHGGVVNAELTRRGAGDLIGTFRKWLKEYRAEILKKRTLV